MPSFPYPMARVIRIARPVANLDGRKRRVEGDFREEVEPRLRGSRRQSGEAGELNSWPTGRVGCEYCAVNIQSEGLAVV